MEYLTINNTNKLFLAPNIDSELCFNEVHTSNNQYVFKFTYNGITYMLTVERKSRAARSNKGEFISYENNGITVKKTTSMLISLIRLKSIAVFINALKSHIKTYH